MLIEVVLFISVDVFSLDNFPDIEKFDGIIDSILDFKVILFCFFQIYLKHLQELFRKCKLLLDGSHESELKYNIFYRVIVNKAALSEVLKALVVWQKLLINENAIQYETPRLNLNFLESK